MYRDFPQADYRVVKTADGIVIHTSRLHLVYNEKEFSSEGLYIQMKGNLSLIPAVRSYTVELHGFENAIQKEMYVSAGEVIIVQIPPTDVTKEIVIQKESRIIK